MFIPLHDNNPLQSIRLQYVTIGIIVVNSLVWLFLGTPSISNPGAAQALAVSFGFIPSVVNDLKTLPAGYAVLPEWTSYITYSFLHADFMHLAGNMLFLWVFADNVEDAMGHVKFLLFYLASAAAGAWMHALVLPNSDAPLIGASGAAAGVIGAYLMLHPNVRVWVLALGRIPLRLKAMWVLGAWILYQVGMIFFTSGGKVSWAAHIGGIVAGIVLVIFLRKPGVPLFDRGPEVAAVSVEEAAVASEIVKSRNPRWGRGKN